jgi:hypothetical protein
MLAAAAAAAYKGIPTSDVIYPETRRSTATASIKYMLIKAATAEIPFDGDRSHHHASRVKVQHMFTPPAATAA